MANIRQAFEYASKNPNSDFAKNLDKLVASGSLNVEAQKNGIDLTPFKPQPVVEAPKRTLGEKVLDFTGGKEISQGLGQAFANPEIAKQQEAVQTQQMDIQGNLIKAIKAKRATGEDATKLEKALADLNIQISDTGNQTGELLNQKGLTTKQVLGDALQLGTTVASVGTFGAGAEGLATGTLGKATPSAVSGMAKATSFGQGLAQGAKTGAISGGTFGTATGISQGLQKDKDLGGIVKEGITTGIGGAVTGGILGGVIGGVSGGIRGAKIKKSEAYLDAVTPNTKDLTPTEYEKLLNQGKITPKTSTSPAKYVLSDGEKEIAKKYKSILTNDPVKNTERIADEISKKDTEVGQFLKKNNGIFNKGELKNSLTLKLENIDDLTVDEKRLAKLKKATIDNFMKGLEKNDMETLWKSRKEFDRTIEKAFSGSPTLQNTIKKEFRNGIQDFIAERTPDNTYKGFMKDMSELFNLKDVVNTKAVKEKGLNALQVWIKRNPTKAKVIDWCSWNCRS